MVEKKDTEQEILRIRKEYARRAADKLLSEKYTSDNPVYRYISEQRHQVLRGLLEEYFPSGLSDLSLLEVGCGSGGVLSELEQLSANPRRLIGLDLLPDRLMAAQQRLEASSFVCGNGQWLPFCEASFDALLQFTAFSSVLDSSMKFQMASEMLRVLKPGGFVIWYDFIWNPINRQTRGIPLSEIKGLFPGCKIQSKQITLAPPLVKLLVPKYHQLADWLTLLGFLNSHLMAFILKPLL